MRVAIIGSWREKDARQWGLRGTQEHFQQASRRVGAEVVARGHTIIVGSDAPHTADCHAAAGAFDAIAGADDAAASGRVIVIRPAPGSDRRHRSSVERPFDQLRRSRRGVVVEYPVDSQTWEEVKLLQTKLADALILVAGAEKTRQAGLTAVVSGKPLACIGSFGGAAHALNEQLFKSPTYWGYQPHETRDLLQLQDDFGDAVLTRALEAAWIEGAPKLMLIHGRSPDRDALKRYLQERVRRVVVLADEYAPTEPIPIKFERYAASVDGAIALLTPDDMGGLANDDVGLTSRARENVWVEVGWFWGRRGRSKLLLLRKGDVSVPSDLGNVEHYHYTDSPIEREEEIQKFVARLRSGDAASE